MTGARSEVYVLRSVLEEATTSKFAAPFFLIFATDVMEVDVVQSAAFAVWAATSSVCWAESERRSRLTARGMIKGKCLRIVKHWGSCQGAFQWLESEGHCMLANGGKLWVARTL